MQLLTSILDVSFYIVQLFMLIFAEWIFQNPSSSCLAHKELGWC